MMAGKERELLQYTRGYLQGAAFFVDDKTKDALLDLIEELDTFIECTDDSPAFNAGIARKMKEMVTK